MGDADVADLLPGHWPHEYERALSDWAGVRWPEVPAGWIVAFDEGVDEMGALRTAGEWVTGPTSLMGVLRLGHLEVQHSRVLRWLLDPAGGHRLGTRVLRAFLAAVERSPGGPLGGPIEALATSLHEAVVTVEEAGVDVETGRRGSVDIVVRSAGLTLVVENKIWAGEHGDQLDRYARTYAAESTVLVYLTPGGVPPGWSAVSRARWHCLSWRRDVVPALQDAVEERRAAGRPCAAVEDYLVALREELGERTG